EKVRTATTDSSGQFRIVDLRGGTYTVTFSLAGFATVKRDGVVLGGENVTTVNAELRVGNVEQTITVTGESPVVDIQTVTRQQVLTQELINTLPTARTYSSFGQTLP